MPAFQWSDDDVIHNFSCSPQSASELVYRLLTNLPPGMDFSERLYLRMYSTLETRWLNMLDWPIEKPHWPYVSVYLIHRNREELFREVRRHADGFGNPCGEIPLGEPQECNFRASGDPISSGKNGEPGMFTIFDLAARIGRSVVTGRTRTLSLLGATTHRTKCGAEDGLQRGR